MKKSKRALLISDIKFQIAKHEFLLNFPLSLFYCSIILFLDVSKCENFCHYFEIFTKQQKKVLLSLKEAIESFLIDTYIYMNCEINVFIFCDKSY